MFLTLKLLPENADKVVRGLKKLPFDEVVGVLGDVMRQISDQAKEFNATNSVPENSNFHDTQGDEDENLPDLPKGELEKLILRDSQRRNKNVKSGRQKRKQ